MSMRKSKTSEKAMADATSDFCSVRRLWPSATSQARHVSSEMKTGVSERTQRAARECEGVRDG